MSLFELLMLNAAVVAGAMFVLWIISVLIKDASIVDIFWGPGFVLIAWTTFAVSDRGTRALLLAVLTTTWGLRLGTYLAWRNSGKGEDPRYTAMREYRGDQFWWISLITVNGLQGVVMWLVSFPVQAGQAVGASVDLSMVNYVGVAVWAVGFLFEAVGDFQLARFKSQADNSGKVMDRGLWRYTRHPNYFGNALIWWGIFLVALTGSTIWTVISPLVMTFLLVKVSGVALLERSLKEKSAEYRDYVTRTSSFLPWPPKSAPG